MNSKMQDAGCKIQDARDKKSGFLLLTSCFLKNDKGFSLLEALVAITILGITLGTIMALFSGGMRSVGASEEYSQALFLARKGMEDTILMEDIYSGTEVEDFDNGYTLERTVNPVEISAEEEYLNEDIPFNLYEVKIKIKWWSGKVEKVVSLKSTVLREGIED